MSFPELRGKRIARVASVKFAIDQITNQVEALAKAQAVITIICAPTSVLPRPATVPSVIFHPVRIERSVNLLGDLVAVFALWKLFRSEKFNIVHSTTPKAGLLVAIASLGAAVPIRLHTFTGQVWATKLGLSRYVLKACDKLIAKCSTATYADSSGQIEFLEAEGVAERGRIRLLGSGSLSGVDTARFDIGRFTDADLLHTRNALNIPRDAKVLIFVGRLHVEKGLRELYEAYALLASEIPELHLLMVGPSEDFDDTFARKVTADGLKSRAHILGSVTDPERYLAISDLLCLPSYREGFGTVVLEAAAMGVPTVASDIYGLRDAVVDGETGMLVPARDAAALRAAIKHLLTSDGGIRERLGEAARQRVRREFDVHVVSDLVLQEYVSLLGARAIDAR